MKFGVTLLTILFATNVFAIDGSWNYSSDHLAKTKTGYYGDSEDMHFEAEVLNYSQDSDSDKRGLDYLRTNFILYLADGSNLETELQGERWDENKGDVDHLSTYIKHKKPLLGFGSVTLSFLTQFNVPMHRESFRQDGVKPVIGLPLDFYHSDRFSTGVAYMMENYSNNQFENWKKKYQLSWYLNYMMTERLSTSLDLYVERQQGAAKLGYQSMTASFVYRLTPEVNVSAGTWIGGDPTLITINSVMGATFIF